MGQLECSTESCSGYNIGKKCVGKVNGIFCFLKWSHNIVSKLLSKSLEIALLFSEFFQQ